MSKKKYHRKTKSPGPAVSIGIGVALIVLAFVFLAVPGAKLTTSSIPSVVPVAVDFSAPELVLENINGTIEMLTDYRHTVVLVNNWATWCPPCKAEMPTLSTYYDEHADDGFTIVAIEAGDPKTVVSEFVQSNHLKFPVWLDPNGDALKAFRNGNLPNSYVIDRGGVVRYMWTGEISREMLDMYITPLLLEE